MRYPGSFVLVMVMGTISLGMILLPDHRRDNITFLSPRRWAGVGFLVLFAIQPGNHLYYNKVAMDTLNPVFFDRMMIACIISALFYLLGWYMAPRPDPATRPRPKSSCPFGYPGLYALASVAALSLITLGIAYGTFSTYFRSPESPYSAVGSAIYNIWGWSFYSLMVLGIVGLVLAEKTGGLLPKLLGWGGCLAYLVISVKLGARLRFVFFVLAMAGFAASRFNRAKFVALLVAVGCLFLVFVFVQGRIRYQFTYDMQLDTIVERVRVQKGLYHDFFMGGDFDAFENGMQLMRAVPDRHNFLYGSTILSVLYNPIPRALWPEKPATTPVSVLVETGYGKGRGSHLNFACSMPAELYVNFWWTGIVIGMALLGYVSRWFYERWTSRKGDALAYAHVGLLSAYTLLVFRGSFHSMTAYYLMVLSWFWMARFASHLDVVGHKACCSDGRSAALEMRLMRR